VCDACVFWIVTMSLVFSELVFAVYRLCVCRLCSLLWPVVCWQRLFGCFLVCWQIGNLMGSLWLVDLDLVLKL
jgi:hypothetical protein